MAAGNRWQADTQSEFETIVATATTQEVSISDRRKKVSFQ